MVPPKKFPRKAERAVWPCACLMIRKNLIVTLLSKWAKIRWCLITGEKCECKINHEFLLSSFVVNLNLSEGICVLAPKLLSPNVFVLSLGNFRLESYWCHSHVWVRAKKAKFSELSGWEGYYRLSSLSITMTLASNRYLWANICSYPLSVIHCPVMQHEQQFKNMQSAGFLCLGGSMS